MSGKYEFKPFIIGGDLMFSHIQIPQEFFEDERFIKFSLNAKVLYSMMVNRLKLSWINKDKYTHESGEVYIIFSNTEVQQKLGCSDKTATKTVKELEQFGLISRVRVGRIDRIFVYNFASLEPPIREEYKISEQIHVENHVESKWKPVEYADEEMPLFVDDRKNYDDIIGDITTVPSEKVRTINNNIINNYLSNNHSIFQKFSEDSENWEEIIKKTERCIKYQIDYDNLIVQQNSNKAQIEELLELILEVAMCQNEYMKIGGDMLLTVLVQRRFAMIDISCIEQILLNLSLVKHRIFNHKSYLLQCLYNSPTTKENQIKLDVECILAGTF